VKPFLQINGVPFQTDGSWASLKGVSHFFKEMVLLSNIKDSNAPLGIQKSATNP